jgi:hypothetical protein
MFMQSSFYYYLVKLFTKCIFYAIFSRAAIDLLKQLKDKDEMSTYMVIDQVFAWIFKSLTSLVSSKCFVLITLICML